MTTFLQRISQPKLLQLVFVFFLTSYIYKQLRFLPGLGFSEIANFFIFGYLIYKGKIRNDFLLYSAILLLFCLMPALKQFLFSPHITDIKITNYFAIVYSLICLNILFSFKTIYRESYLIILFSLVFFLFSSFILTVYGVESTISDAGKFKGLSGNPNQLSGFITLLPPIAFAGIKYRFPSFIEKRFYICLFSFLLLNILIIVIQVISASESGLFFSVVIFVLFYFFIFGNLPKALYGFINVSALCFITFSIFLPILYLAIISQYDIQGAGNQVQSRFNLWSNYFLLLTSDISNFFFGLGVGDYGSPSEIGVLSRHEAHSTIIDLWSNYGFIPLIIYHSTLMLCGWISFKRNDSLSLVFLCSLISFGTFHTIIRIPVTLGFIFIILKDKEFKRIF